MPEKISAKTAPHYTWGTECDGWRLVQGEELSVIQERMPPGTAEERHRHAVTRQFFYVLSGRLTIEADGGDHELLPGEGIEIAPGIAHQVHCPAEGEAAVFLVVSQPGNSRADRTPA